MPSLFDHFQFALIYGPDIPGSYAILLFTDLVLFSSVFTGIQYHFATIWYGSSISTFTYSYFFHFQVRHGWFIQSPSKIEYINRHPKFNMFINELLLLPTISPSPWVSPYLSWWQHHPSICSNQKKRKKREREMTMIFVFFFNLTHCNTYSVYLETHKLHVKTHPGFHYFPYFLIPYNQDCWEKYL